MAIQDMATAAPPDMPSALAATLNHLVSPSPVHVAMRNDPAERACSLRLRCTLTSSYEQHVIGGPGPEVADEEGPTVYESALDDVDLRSNEACSAAVLELFSALPIPGPVSLLDPAAGQWHEPVVGDIVGQVQQLVTTSEARDGCALDVSLSIRESFRYDKPEALLLACEDAATTIPASQLAPDERCAVCMERLLPANPPDEDDGHPAACTDEEKAFTLPSCGHMFHRGCVAAWFEKGSTCPLCRCDMMDCLTHLDNQLEI